MGHKSQGVFEEPEGFAPRRRPEIRQKLYKLSA